MHSGASQQRGNGYVQRLVPRSLQQPQCLDVLNADTLHVLRAAACSATRDDETTTAEAARS